MLFKIISEIQPDVIFEELSQEKYENAYIHNTLATVEIVAIKEYLKYNSVAHISIDTYPLPENYYTNIDLMYERILSISDAIKALDEVKKDSIIVGGFDYLNSDENDIYFDNLKLLKESALNELNNEDLFDILQLEKDIIAHRENEIINNIYDYYKQSNFKNALLIIGSGHRKSLFGLINKLANDNGLVWNRYSGIGLK